MTRANMQLSDYQAMGRPQVDDLTQLAAPLSTVLTQELDGAAEALGFSADEVLIAALGRTIQRTIGDGSVTVDLPGFGARIHSMTLRCAAPEQSSANEMLAGVHDAVASLKVRRVVHGVPADARAHRLSDVLFVQDDTAPARGHLGHILEVRAYRHRGVMALDWWFDTRSFEAYTVQELAEQFPLALIELTSEATPPVLATSELAMAH